MDAHHARWLERLPYDSPLAYRQALVLQYLALFVIGAAVVGIGLAPLANQILEGLISALAIYIVALLGVLSAIWLLRRGSLRAAGITIVLVILAVTGAAMALYGRSHIQFTLPSLAIPVVLAGMLLGRRMLWLTTALAVAIVAVTSLGMVYAPQWFGTLRVPEAHPLVFTAGFALVIVILTLILDRFSGLLRQALDADARK